MTRRSRTLFVGCCCLALATPFGAYSATPPVDLRRENLQLRAKVAALEAKVWVLENQVEAYESGKVSVPAVPGASGAIQNAPTSLTPKSDWIPREINGQTFYVIPCKPGGTSTTATLPTAAPTEYENFNTSMKPRPSW